MSFNPNYGSISSSSDVDITNIDGSNYLKFDSVSQKWINHTPQVANITGLQSALDGKQAAIPIYSDEAAVLTALNNNEIAVGDIVGIVA